MKQETKEVIGEVQNIRKDRKALELYDIWYQSNFKLIPDNINKGDNVLITYSERGEFKNVVSIVKQESKETKNLDNDNSKTLTKSIKDSTTINNLVMVSKDIFIAMEGKKTLKEVTTDVINAYKQIIENISK